MLEQMSLAYIWLDYMNYIITFWKIFLATSITGVFGAWSNQNCSVSEIQKYDGYITCECNHLTNFALLMDVSQSRNDPLALSIVTWIGCGISMLGLMLTIITFLYFKLVYLMPFFVSSIFKITNFKYSKLTNYKIINSKLFFNCLHLTQRICDNPSDSYFSMMTRGNIFQKLNLASICC